MAFDENLNPYVRQVRMHPGISTSIESVLSTLQGKKAVVDLGCGNGHFLRDYLAQHPDYVGVGVERRFKRIFKTAEKLKELSAHVIQWDVPEFLRLSPSGFWQEIWMQFPDPWPKLRHEKNRMITPELLGNIERSLANGGRFCFRSDCREYWEFLQMESSRRNLFAITKSLQGDLFAEEPSTLYQKKFFQRSVPIYSLEFKAVK